MSEQYIKYLHSGLPKRDLQSKIVYQGDVSRQDAKDYLSIMNNPELYKHKLIYLYGNYGTQKTTMSVVLGEQLIRLNYKVKYILFNDLLRLVSSFNLSEEDEANFDDIKNCDFLFIDEFGDDSSCTLYKNTMSSLSTFVRNRYDVNNKNIIFISTVPSNKLFANSINESLKNLINTTLEIDKLNNIKTQFEFLDNYIEILKNKTINIQKEKELKELETRFS